MNPMTVPTPDGTWTFTPSGGALTGLTFPFPSPPPSPSPVPGQMPAGLDQIIAQLLPVLLPRLLQLLGPLLGGVGAATGNPLLGVALSALHFIEQRKQGQPPGANPDLDAVFQHILEKLHQSTQAQPPSG